MKILSVVFENIHSLKGKHQINFDQAPLSEATVFAIVGPTGAGKTTILDAIAVALYNQIPRHESKQPSEIMTRHTGNCFAEVVFESKNKQYRVRWELQRARGKHDGTLQSPKMWLYELVGEQTVHLEEGTSKVPNMVKAITGLGYEQFTRSVILPQGNFAAFLKANKNERSELLEQIMGAEIYRRISKAAYDKAKEERETLAQLKEATKHINLLSDEVAAQFQQNIADNRATIKEKQASQATIQSQLQTLTNLDKLQADWAKQTQVLHDCQTQYEALAQDREKIALHQKAEVLKDNLQEYNNTYKEREELNGEIRSKQHEWQELSHTKKTALEDEATKKELSEKAQKTYDIAKPQLDKAIELQHQIAADNKLIAEDETRLADLNQQKQQLSKAKQLQIETAKEAIAKKESSQLWLQENAVCIDLNADLPLLDNYKKQYNDELGNADKLNKEIETAQLLRFQLSEQVQALSLLLAEKATNLSDKTKACEIQQAKIEQLIPRSQAEQQISDLQQQMAQAKELTNLAQQCQTQRSEIESLKQEHTAQTHKLEQLNSSRKNDEAMHEKEQEILNLLDQARFRERAIADLSEKRKQLKAAQPCPLCGSTEHPFVQDQYQSNESKAENDYEQQKQKVAQLQNKINQQQNQITTIETEIKERRENAQKIQGNMRTNQAAFAQIKAQNDKLPNIDLEQVAQWQQYVQELDKQISQINLVLTQIKQGEADLKNAEKEKIEAEKQHTETNNNLSTTKLKLDNAESEWAKLSKQIEATQAKVQQQESKIMDLIQKYANANQAMTAAHLKQIDKITDKLKQRKKDFEQYQQLCSQAEQQIGISQTELKNIDQRIEQNETDTDKLNKAQQGKKNQLAQLQTQFDAISAQMQCPNPAQEKERLEKERDKTKAELEEAKRVLILINHRNGVLASEIDKCKTKLEPLNIQYDFLSQEIQGKAQKLGFNTLLAVQDALLEPEYANELRHTLNQADNNLQTAQKNQQTLQTEIAQLKTQVDATQTIESLQQGIELLQGEINEYNQAIGNLQAQLNDNEQKKLQLGDKQREINEQQQTYDKWEALNKLIGSSSGDKFSRFAQSLTLDQLVTMANKHLAMLNDRYQIRQVKNQEEEPPLELEIIDRYLADTIRQMRSLSGGETFLVSLALALGLSDLAGRNTQIKSLFIDEGFGTLDEATLYMAIATLESLQTQGRSVGIISHVKDLQDNINTRIEVKKQGNGISTLQVLVHNQYI
jgi:exonuclease SbcC